MNLIRQLKKKKKICFLIKNLICTWTLQKLQMGIWWFVLWCWRLEDKEQKLLAMEVSNAFSMSLVTCCLIRVIAYSMSSASHGNVRGPVLCDPNSSYGISNSSRMIWLLRHWRGSKRRFWSEECTTKQPFSAFAADVQQDFLVSVFPTVCGSVILFRLITACFCHFLAILGSFLGLIVLLLLYKGKDLWRNCASKSTRGVKSECWSCDG